MENKMIMNLGRWIISSLYQKGVDSIGDAKLSIHKMIMDAQKEKGIIYEFSDFFDRDVKSQLLDPSTIIDLFCIKGQFNRTIYDIYSGYEKAGLLYFITGLLDNRYDVSIERFKKDNEDNSASYIMNSVIIVQIYPKDKFKNEPTKFDLSKFGYTSFQKVIRPSELFTMSVVKIPLSLLEKSYLNELIKRDSQLNEAMNLQEYELAHESTTKLYEMSMKIVNITSQIAFVPLRGEDEKESNFVIHPYVLHPSHKIFFTYTYPYGWTIYAGTSENIKEIIKDDWEL